MKDHLVPSSGRSEEYSSNQHRVSMTSVILTVTVAVLISVVIGGGFMYFNLTVRVQQLESKMITYSSDNDTVSRDKRQADRGQCFVCPPGAQGPRGLPGFKGRDGRRGTDGARGPKGHPGADGKCKCPKPKPQQPKPAPKPKPRTHPPRAGNHKVTEPYEVTTDIYDSTTDSYVTDHAAGYDSTTEGYVTDDHMGEKGYTTTGGYDSTTESYTTTGGYETTTDDYTSTTTVYPGPLRGNNGYKTGGSGGRRG